MLFVKEIAQKHQHTGDDDHAQQQGQRFARLYTGDDIVDGRNLTLL